MDDIEPLWRRILMFPIRSIGWVVTWLLEGLSAASQGFERGFRWATGGFSRVAEMADQGESGLSRVLAVVLWPVMAPFRLLLRLAESLQLSPFFRSLGRWTKWLWYPFVAVAGFIAALFATRRQQLIWWAIPLVVLSAPILFLILRVSLQQDSQITARYRKALAAAIENRDYQQAELFQQKLSQLGGRNEQMEFQTANALINDGKTTEAVEIIKRLAPLDGTGNTNAHLWMAQHLLSQPAAENRDEVLDEVTQHLMWARRGTTGEIPAVGYLESLVALEKKDFETGLKNLKLAATKLLPAAAQKLEISLSMQATEEAKIDASNFLRLVQDEKDMASISNSRTYALWLSAERLAGTPEGVQRVLGMWNSAFPEDERLAMEQQVESIREFEKNMLTANELPPDQIAAQLLKIGEVKNSGNRKLLSARINELLNRSKSEPDLSQVFASLEASSETPAYILEFLGTDAVVKQDFGRARTLLQRAVNKNPDDHVAWNNLAYLLQQAYPDEINEALRASTRSVELAPDNFDARETRGMIYVRLNRWSEAITDLEIAINGIPGSKEIHQALAKAYQETGNVTLAKIHERKAAE
jgi:tetratricopeptide (TPR) repeat protein